MATLRKFKHLATQCAVVAESPTRSPFVHLRRRKTLRMLLNRSTTPASDDHSRRSPCNNHRLYFREREESSPEKINNKKNKIKEKIRARHKLKDLFEERESYDDVDDIDNDGDDERDALVSLPETVRLSEAEARRTGSVRRPLSFATFRYRLLLRRAWRPVLVTIPEQ